MSPDQAPIPRRRRPLRTQGTVVKVHDENVATVRLSNGYEALAHRPHSASPSSPSLAPGMIIGLEFSPCDMGHACILPQVD